MIQKLRYRAYETEIVRPFETFDRLFEDCKLSVSNDEGFLNNQNIVVEEDSDCLQLALKFDKLKIPSNYQSDLSNLAVNVFFKDLQGSKNFQKLYSKKIEEIEYVVVDLEPLVPANYLVGEPEILLVLVNEGPSTQYERLAKKTFKFFNARQALSFPRVYRTAEEFEDAGFYKYAPFAIKWIGEDLDKPINQLIELWLNNTHELQMETFGLSDQSFSKTMMGVFVIQEILFTIMMKSIEANNFEATASATVFKLMDTLSISADDVVAVSGSQDFKSIVNSWAMQLLKLDVSFQNEFS